MSDQEQEQSIEESPDTVAFEDDSSAHLGLDHAATRVDGFAWNEENNARLKRELDAQGISYVPRCLKCNETEKHPRHAGANADHGFEPPRKSGAYDDINAHIQQVRSESPELPEVDAVRIGRQRAGASEAPITPADRNRDYMGAPTSVLMGHDAPKGGGSSNSGVKRKKQTKWICKECHLELCQHRIPKSRKKKTGNAVGRPVKRDGAGVAAGRSSKITACVTPATPQAVKDDGTASAGEIVEAVVETAQRQGLAISDVLESLDETTPKRCEVPGCLEPGEYAVFDDEATRYRYYCFDDAYRTHDWEKKFKETA